MRKLLQNLLAGLLGFCLLILLIWSGAHLFTTSSQIARAIAWLDSDVQDYKRFPARIIENAPPVFNFQQPSDALRAQYAPALQSITYSNGKQTITQDLETFLRKTKTTSFLVIQDDILLYEGYFNGYDRTSIVTSFSVAKSFVSALVGIAISEGYIANVEDPITLYVPELLEKDPAYARITLRHLLSMSSGIRYEEHGLPWSDDASTYYAPDLRQVALSSPIIGPPGQQFHYNNYHPLLLGLVLERVTKRPVAQYLSEKLWQPLGMEAPGSWSLDSEHSAFEKMESGINGRAIDFAKFGRLFLHKGRWNGVQLIPQAWVDESTRLDTVTNRTAEYQYLWWVYPQTAVHHFFAAGKHGQYIYIIPEQKLILVRFGKSDPLGAWSAIFEQLAHQIAVLEQ